MNGNPVTARLHYATIAMIELAKKYDAGGLTCVRDIADHHGIPLPFLTQILNQLRSHGLVTSVRGAAGGYRLGRSPDQITMADIAAVWSLNSDSATASNSEVARLSNQLWADANQRAQEYLSSVTLEALTSQLNEANMFHI